MTTEHLVIKGAGGGGGGKGGGGGGAARVAVEDPDTLQSKQFARVLDLLGEGEMEGFTDADPAKCIYLDETPLRSPDGTLNFSSVAVNYRLGTQGQAYIPGFENQEAEVAVNVRVQQATPVVRQITNTDVKFARVTLMVPALTSQDTTNGDLHGTSVTVRIEVQAFGGSYVIKNLGGAEAIAGKTRSKYQRAFLIPLTGAAPWNIRVSRITADSVVTAVQNQTWWDSYTEVIPVQMTYPNSVIVATSIDASQFSSIPSRAYSMKLLRVKVPSNYNPVTRAYTGVWNGTFTVAWTDNPAWCYYDLITNTRYGLGQHIPATLIDKWGLYTIGQYCDGSVPNGFGGTEPRFTLNVYIQTRQEAYKVMSDLASVFRGMVYWSSGALLAVQDSPTDPVAIFNATNVIDGQFQREGSGRKARHTAAVVQWNDPADRYRMKSEYVEDPVGVARYGLRQTDVIAFGTTSQGQANRVGRWILFTERYESEVISFATGLDAAYVRPGQIAKIVDPGRSNARYGGRVLGATSTSVTVDASITLAAGVNTLSLVMPDGTLAERTLTNTAGAHTVLTFAAALPSIDIKQALWVVGTPSITPELIRVLSIAEASPTTYRITGVAHYPAKFAAVELAITLQAPRTSNLLLVPAPVTNLTGSEYLYKAAGAVFTRLVVSFTGSPTAVSYIVSYRRPSGNWITLQPSSLNHIEVDDVVPDIYTIQVVALSGRGKSSTALEAVYTVLGKAGIPPANVTGFTATTGPQQMQLAWVEVPDLDLSGYEIREGPGWSSGTTLISGYAGTTFQVPAPAAGPHTYHIKAIDTSNNYSATETSVTLTIVQHSAPAVSISVVADQAVLSWIGSTNGDFLIDYYVVRIGTVWASATPVTTVKGTSLRVPADWLDLRTFLVAAVDIAGNVGTAGSTTLTINAPSPPSVSASVSGESFLLGWTTPAASLPIEQYEVRYGASFAAGTSLGTIKGSTFSQKVQWLGARHIWVAAIDVRGNVGTAGSTTLDITAPSAPTVALQVVDNNVLLSWADAQQTLPIRFYQVSRGVTFSGSTVIGNIDGRFSTIFEKSSGSYTYWIVGVDSAGNPGTSSGQTAFVNQPPDYVLYNDINSQMDSTTKSNVIKVNGLHYALVLNGSTHYARVVSAPLLDAAMTALTFTQWFSPDSISANGGLIDKTVAGATDACATLAMTGSAVKFRVKTAGTVKEASASLTGYLPGQWIQATGRWDGTNVKIALQGANVDSIAATGALSVAAGELLIGNRGTGVSGYFLAGKLGPGRIYTRALTDTEVLEHYRGIFKSETSLVSAWNYSEGSGGSAQDDSDNAYDLQLMSAPPWALTELDGRFDNTAGGAMLLYPVSATKTFDELFNAGARTTPQANITAGYTRYCNPNEATGQYVEVVDFGAAIPSSLIMVTLTSSAIDGTVTVTPKLSIKTLLGDAWTDFAGVWSVYGTNFRYLKVTLDITATAGANVAAATVCNFRLDVKLKNDGGMATCVSTDSGGTTVNFNVTFVDVNSITVTPAGTTVVTPVYDFTDTPNPTSFKILLFNSAGTRVSGTASWAANGV